MIVIAAIFGLNTVVAFLGNLFVLLVVILYRRFHNMRYFLLASLALSDFLLAALAVSCRAVATALEKWIFGTAWCHGAAFVIRMLHFSTVFHLCAVSYERYNVIVKKPLTYNGRIKKKRAFLNIMLLWVLPTVISLGPVFGWGDYVYNPEVFSCEQKWDKQTTVPFLIFSFLVPLGAIFFLNYKLLKVVSRLQRSVELINSLPAAEEIMPDCQGKQPQCPRDGHDNDAIELRPKGKDEEEDEEIANGEHENSPQSKQNVGTENAAYQTDPEDIADSISPVKCKSHGAKYQCHERQHRSHEVQYQYYGDSCQSHGAQNRSYETQYQSYGVQCQCHETPKGQCRSHETQYQSYGVQCQCYETPEGQCRSHETQYQSYGVQCQCHETPEGQCRSHATQLANKPNNKSSFKTKDNDPTKINKENDGTGRSKDKKSREHNENLHIQQQVAENGEEDKSAKMDIQIGITEHCQLSVENDREGLQGNPVCQTQTLMEGRGSIRPTFEAISMEDASGRESSDSQSGRPSLAEEMKRISRRKAKVSPRCKIQVDEAQACQVNSGKENGTTSRTTEEAFQDDNLEENEIQAIKSILKDKKVNNIESIQRTPPGKTQMRLAKLLKEGKAARDVTIIIGAFVLCYLPTWIMALYRTLGGLPHAEAIMSTHCIYSLTMVCNPIIYSVRKKEFRKALKKMLRL